MTFFFHQIIFGQILMKPAIVCLQRFMRELKCPNQRQGAFLRHLKCPNQNGYEAQSCSTKKVGFSKWCRFFDSMIFRPWPLPSGGF